MNWLVKISFPQMNAPVPKISLQEAHDTCNMEIGELFHGTDNLEIIDQEGFAYNEEESYSGSTSHGFDPNFKHNNCRLPVHYLGYGVYLTQVKNQAKNYGSFIGKGYYLLKNANYITINFHTINTIMNKFWILHDYDCSLAEVDRVAATKQMTDNLRSQYDFILQSGASLRGKTGGDGNQVCVYNMNIIRQVDKKLTRPGEIGSCVIKVKERQIGVPSKVPIGMKGVLVGRRPIESQFAQYHNGEPEFLTIKWQRGGTDMNVYPSEIEFI